MKLRRLATQSSLVLALTLLSVVASANNSSFVWANQPNTAWYVPAASYSHNDAGMTNTVVRLSAGRYTVFMPIAGTPNHGGNVQVSAYGGRHRCKVSSWGKTANVDVKINVRCHNEYGVLTDGKFTALYHDAVPNGEDLAFAYINQANPTSYGTTPPAYHRHNMGRVDDTLSNFWYWRASRGTYHVYSSDFSSSNRNWLVTAKGQEFVHCNLADEDHELATTPSGAWIERNHALVRCYDTLGQPTDSRFTIAVAQERGFGSTGAPSAYMHMDRPTASSSVGARNGTWNSESNTPASSTRIGTGQYKVLFYGTGGKYSKSTAQVTAESARGEYCNVNGWRDVWSFTEVTVHCFAAGGSRADSQFHLTFLTAN